MNNICTPSDGGVDLRKLLTASATRKTHAALMED